MGFLYVIGFTSCDRLAVIVYLCLSFYVRIAKVSTGSKKSRTLVVKDLFVQEDIRKLGDPLEKKQIGVREHIGGHHKGITNLNNCT